MASTNFKFSNTKTSIIMYDLSPNHTTASEIAEASNGALKTSISMKNNINYLLPNTTLYCYLPRDKAKQEFESSLNKAGNYETITRLFIIEVDGKDGYIKDEQ